MTSEVEVELLRLAVEAAKKRYREAPFPRNREFDDYQRAVAKWTVAHRQEKAERRARAGLAEEETP